MPATTQQASIGKRYRLIMKGDKLQEGDEGFSFGSKTWFVLGESFWGGVVTAGLYRRMLP